MRWQAFVCGFALTACTPAAAQVITGPATAKDGDSLLVGTQEIRLHGIDAPEYNQTCTKNGQRYRCGEDAHAFLSQLVSGKMVKCVSVGIDQYERILGQCTVGDIDVNARMVAAGHAVAFRRFSTAYVSAENSAKAARRGLWAGEFDMPSDYRDTQNVREVRAPLPGRAYSAPTQPSGDCRIKGNRGSNGWIYHVPGQEYYSRTKAEEMFCTEEQARAAGYRRARTR